MPTSYPHLDRISWRRWLSFSDDAAFADAGAAGELLIAQVRVVITALLLLIPAYNLAVSPLRENVVGFGIAVGGVALAVLVLFVVKNIPFRRWVGMGTTALDVSIVSLALSIFLVLGTPHTAVNSRVVFDVYFLAIGATCLRKLSTVDRLTGVLNRGFFDERMQMTPTHLTISVGIASAPDDGKEVDDLLHSADVRLFEAKRAGRDRVVGPDGIDGQSARTSPQRRVSRLG